VASLRDDKELAELKELLAHEEVSVKLATFSQAIEPLCPDAGMRNSIVEQAKAKASEPHGKKGDQFVNFDEMMHLVINQWQEVEDRRLGKQRAQLGKLFDETDDNNNNILDFGEFQTLITHNPHTRELGFDRLLDIYDVAISNASDETGEEMDSITREAFMTVGAEYDLLPRDPHSFASIAALKQQDSARAVPKGGGSGLSKGWGMAKKGRVKRTLIAGEALEGESKSEPKSAPMEPKSNFVTAVIKTAVSKNFLFRHLTERNLDEVVSCMEPQPVKKGDSIIKQGDKGDFFYVCESGAYGVYVNGEKVHTYVVEPSNEKYPCFGELALMYAKPRAATVIADNDGMLWKLSRGGFRRVQGQQAQGDLLKVLRKVDVFSSLRFDQLQTLRDHMESKRYKHDEIIFKQGEVGDQFYVIMEGKVSVVRQDAPELPEVFLASLGENNYFGERALLQNEPRAATVRAMSDLRIMSLSRAEFEQLLGSLQAILEEANRQREEAALKETRQLEVLKLSNAQRGSFGTTAFVCATDCGGLYTAVHFTTGTSYTVREETKAMLVENAAQERVQREVRLFKLLGAEMLQTACLPQLLKRFQTDDSLYWLFKGQACCDLSTLVELVPELPEHHLRFIAACVVHALDLLHSHLGALYRNLVPENLYIMETGYISLLDFRFAKIDDGNSRTLCGAPGYFAPEVVRGEPQSAATDWWAVGVLLYELCCGDSPWGATDADDMTILKRITAHLNGSLALPENVSPRLADLIDSLLTPSSDSRLGARGGEEVQSHTWFADINWSHLASAELSSPLTVFARDQLAQRVEVGPGDELASGQPPVIEDTSWMEGFEEPRK